jgi:hypothetical protein
MSDQLIEKWRREAEAVLNPAEDAGVPIHVLFGEAVDLVGFVGHYGLPQHDAAGRLLQPGLGARSQRHSHLAG